MDLEGLPKVARVGRVQSAVVYFVGSNIIDLIFSQLVKDRSEASYKEFLILYTTLYQL